MFQAMLETSLFRKSAKRLSQREFSFANAPFPTSSSSPNANRLYFLQNRNCRATERGSVSTKVKVPDQWIPTCCRFLACDESRNLVDEKLTYCLLHYSAGPYFPFEKSMRPRILQFFFCRISRVMTSKVATTKLS
jgi:hypothetical protein